MDFDKAHALDSKCKDGIPDTKESALCVVEEVMQIVNRLETYDNEINNCCQRVFYHLYNRCTTYWKEVYAVVIERQYPEFAITSLKWFYDKGVFDDPAHYFTYLLTLVNLSISTNDSLDLGLILGKKGMVQFCLQGLSNVSLKEILNEEQITEMDERYIGILFNLSKIPENQCYFNSEDVTKTLQNYTTHKNEQIKGRAIALLLRFLDDGGRNALQETAMEKGSPVYHKVQALVLESKYKHNRPDTQEAALGAIDEIMQHLHDMNTYDNELNKWCQLVCYWIRKKCSNHLRKVMCARLIEKKYPEFAVKSLKWIFDCGLFHNENRWLTYTNTMVNLMNFTNDSPQLGLILGKMNMVQFCFFGLKDESDTQRAGTAKIIQLDQDYLILLFTISKVPENKLFFREQNRKKILEEYTTDTNPNPKARMVAMMTLVNVLEENEDTNLQDTDTIGSMINYIRQANEDGLRRSHGFYSWELVTCFVHLTVIDANKAKIVDHGALPLLVGMLDYIDLKENAAVSTALWNLSFDKDIKQKMIKEKELIAGLEKLKSSKDKKVRNAAVGALWTLIDEDKHKSEKTGESSRKDSHIFLSYNWGNQETIKRIHKKLLNEGYKVSIIVEQTGESMLEAMANGIDKADVVIIAVSEKYKNSPNCRAEASYIFDQKKPVIPIMMQKHYRPDGWLGMLTASKLFCSFYEESQFDKGYSELLNELHKAGVKRQDDVDGALSSKVEALTTSTTSTTSQSSTPMPKEEGISEWDKERTRKWLDDNELGHLKEALSHLNGKRLKKLKDMNQRTPDNFYKMMTEEYHLSMRDAADLSSELDNLPE